MSLSELLFASSRRVAAGSSARRRPKSLALSLEGLESRVVLSHAAALPPVAAQVHALAQPAARALRVPITLTGATVTSLTQAANGVVNLAGTLTGTILGQNFSTPFTGTITPARNARSCPVLNLNIQPISLSLLGLNVNTSAICLNITARQGGGLLGNLLCGGLNNVLSLAGTNPTSAITQINSTLNDPQALGSVNQVLGRASTARLRSFTPAQAGNCPVVNLSLGPVRLNLLGLNVRLDNCNNGPVNVNVTATQGGGLLGNLLCGLTGNRGAQLRQLGGVLQQISNTHLPA